MSSENLKELIVTLGEMSNPSQQTSNVDQSRIWLLMRDIVSHEKYIYLSSGDKVLEEVGGYIIDIILATIVYFICFISNITKHFLDLKIG